MADQERAQWGSQVEYLLTMVSYAVGLGNIWRFPYLCFSHGGGAFLIPYFLMLALVGLPIFYMEVAIGQFCGKGPTKCWSLSPIFKGLGWASFVVCAMICVYYNVLGAYILLYFVLSLTSELPWSHCSNGNGTWAHADRCLDIDSNHSLIPGYDDSNASYFKTPTEEFFYNYMLKITDGLDDWGTIPWRLLVALAVAWILVALVLTKGVASLGKTVYVTSLFPYVMITILLVNNLLQDGASEGIKYYMTPDLSKLGNVQVWSDAATQIFFSLGCCQGGLMAMSSYNPFNKNCYRDTLAVSFINCGTSFYAGFAIFAALGHMAHIKGVAVADVASSGPELAFVAYPQALTTMKVAPLWAILFFFMMALLALGTEFSIVETCVTSLVDLSPKLMQKWKTMAIRFGLIFLFFVLGLPNIFQSGLYFLSIVNAYAGGIPLIIVGLFECIAVSYAYGVNNFCDDLELMLGFKPGFYWKLMWKFVTPGILLAVFILQLVLWETYTFTGYTYSTDHPYEYPNWMLAIVILMIVGPLFIIIAGGFIEWRRIGGGFTWQGLKKAAAPAEDWGPQKNRDLSREPSKFTGMKPDTTIFGIEGNFKQNDPKYYNF